MLTQTCHWHHGMQPLGTVRGGVATNDHVSATGTYCTIWYAPPAPRNSSNPPQFYHHPVSSTFDTLSLIIPHTFP